jgi:hypothetical protein
MYWTLVWLDAQFTNDSLTASACLPGNCSFFIFGKDAVPGDRVRGLASTVAVYPIFLCFIEIIGPDRPKLLCLANQ